MSRFERDDAAQVRHMRQGGEATSVVGYVDDGGAPRAIRGDESFPYVKDPPDIERFSILRRKTLPDGSPNGLPTVATLGSYEISPEVDVSGWRILNLFLSYRQGAQTTEGGSSGALSFYMQGMHSRADGGAGGGLGSRTWLPIGVVNPALVTGGLTANQADAAARYLYPAEFRIDPRKLPDSATYQPAITGNGNTIDMALSFDVSMYTRVRFLWGDLFGAPVSDPRLDATYLLQR